MADPARTHLQILKLFILPVFTLFLVPGIALGFVIGALVSMDGDFTRSIDARIDADTRHSAAEKADGKEFFHAHAPSLVCASTDPQGADLRARLCEQYGEIWQFSLARQVAFWSLLVGGAALLAALLLGGLAFLNRRAQYMSFLVGWRLLVLVSALETVAQGALLVWLSFWMTAYFFHMYSVKLVAFAGIIAAVAVFVVVAGIFRRLPPDGALEGELVEEADAPGLWARVRELAARIGTEPPRQIIAGIDANFFVSEAPLRLAGATLTGRSLYVSLPLLRLLDEAEADAVLSHELAHFRGGDTRSSAALGPKIAQYDLYCASLSAGFMKPVHSLMNLYRAIFEFALKREMREREFTADRVAASVKSPPALVQSLLKVSAYSTYRSHTERQLFARGERHAGSVGIAQSVSAGLPPYASSPQFVEDMQSASMPHPFDSHPRLPDRMANVGHTVAAADYGTVVTQPPQRTWAQDIRSAPGIEERLWADYERRFIAAHELNLCYRYRPEGEAELALVEKYFPPQRFALKKGGEIIVAWAGITLPERAEAMSWDEVAKATIENSSVLSIEHPAGSAWGKKPTKIKLSNLGKQQDGFKAAFGRYWQRHQVSRQAPAAGG